jgi:hypothetical protein
MKHSKRYVKWLHSIKTNQSITPTLQIGVVYWGDTGNGNMVCGILISYEDGWAILKDIRGMEHRVIESTLRSAQ